MQMQMKSQIKILKTKFRPIIATAKKIQIVKIWRTIKPLWIDEKCWWTITAKMVTLNVRLCYYNKLWNTASLLIFKQIRKYSCIVHEQSFPYIDSNKLILFKLYIWLQLLLRGNFFRSNMVWNNLPLALSSSWFWNVWGRGCSSKIWRM